MAEFDTGVLYNVFIFLLISICLTTGIEIDGLSQSKFTSIFQILVQDSEQMAQQLTSAIS